MFECQNCQTQTKLGQPVNYVVTEQRPQEYQKLVRRNNEGYRYREPQYETISGWEIVRQIKVCPPCYQSMTGLQPRMIEEKRPVEPVRKPRPRQQFHQIKVDKSDPNWRRKQELDEIRRRESKSPDPRGKVERKKPVIEFISRPPKS
jgi:hypothetical protein